LENGQHSSINVYNCEILPNSMMGDKKYRDLYAINSVRTPAVLSHSLPDVNEICEYDEIVIGTNTMPPKDWSRSCIFSWAIQCFHCLGLTQHIAIFARNECDISYSQFYKDLITYGEKNPESIVGRELSLVSGIINDAIAGGSWEFVINKFGEISWPIEEGSFLNIVVAKKEFYIELENYLLSYLKTTEKSKVFGVLKYSSQMLIDPFCPQTMALNLEYDFNAYFNEFYRGADRPKLIRRANKLEFSDIKEFGGDLPSYAREIIWYGRKGGKFFHSQNKIKVTPIDSGA